MTQQFEQEREVWTTEKRELQVREEERKKETKRMKMKHNLEVKGKQLSYMKIIKYIIIIIKCMAFFKYMDACMYIMYEHQLCVYCAISIIF